MTDEHPLPSHSHQDQLANSEEFQLKQARKVLADVATTSEKTAEKDSSLFAGHTREEIGNATAIVATSIFKTHAPEKLENPKLIQTIDKKVEGAHLTLQVHPFLVGGPGGNEFINYDRPAKINLDLREKNDDHTWAFYVLLEPKHALQNFTLASIAHHTAQQQREPTHTAQARVKQSGDFTTEDFRQVTGGMRWICANLLVWDEQKIVTPRELNISLPGT